MLGHHAHLDLFHTIKKKKKKTDNLDTLNLNLAIENFSLFACWEQICNQFLSDLFDVMYYVTISPKYFFY